MAKFSEAHKIIDIYLLVSRCLGLISSRLWVEPVYQGFMTTETANVSETCGGVTVEVCLNFQHTPCSIESTLLIS